MKKTIALVCLCAFLAGSIAGCGEKKESPKAPATPAAPAAPKAP